MLILALVFVRFEFWASVVDWMRLPVSLDRLLWKDKYWLFGAWTVLRSMGWPMSWKRKRPLLSLQSGDESDCSWKVPWFLRYYWSSCGSSSRSVGYGNYISTHLETMSDSSDILELPCSPPSPSVVLLLIPIGAHYYSLSSNYCYSSYHSSWPFGICWNTWLLARHSTFLSILPRWLNSLS